ncbi:MAG: hypothetical protein ACK5L5_11765 [Bacteroidales bacterium]
MSQTYWDSKPEAKSGRLSVETYFDGKEGVALKVGEEVRLVASVTMEDDAECVMINIPIPAGCSYGDRQTRNSDEVHVEYFKKRSNIFCDKTD